MPAAERSPHATTELVRHVVPANPACGAIRQCRGLIGAVGLGSDDHHALRRHAIERGSTARREVSAVNHDQVWSDPGERIHEQLVVGHRRHIPTAVLRYEELLGPSTHDGVTQGDQHDRDGVAYGAPQLVAGGLLRHSQIVAHVATAHICRNY